MLFCILGLLPNSGLHEAKAAEFLVYPNVVPYNATQ
jgi:hypothetical protein